MPVLVLAQLIAPIAGFHASQRNDDSAGTPLAFAKRLDGGKPSVFALAVASCYGARLGVLQVLSRREFQNSSFNELLSISRLRLKASSWSNSRISLSCDAKPGTEVADGMRRTQEKFIQPIHPGS